jgi:hypothetical protein
MLQQDRELMCLTRFCQLFPRVELWSHTKYALNHDNPSDSFLRKIYFSIQWNYNYLIPIFIYIFNLFSLDIDLGCTISQENYSFLIYNIAAQTTASPIILVAIISFSALFLRKAKISYACRYPFSALCPSLFYIC